MEAQVEQRRLTSILAADVVGYSRLMGADEAGTLAALKAHRRELIDPKTAQHNGRLVNIAGDGALMEFASVVDAVRFAVELQEAITERNSSVPEYRRIRFRIGINIGDGRTKRTRATQWALILVAACGGTNNANLLQMGAVRARSFDWCTCRGMCRRPGHGINSDIK